MPDETQSLAEGDVWALVESYAAALVDCAANPTHESAKAYAKLAESNVREALAGFKPQPKGTAEPVAWLVKAGHGKYTRGIYESLDEAELFACCDGDSIIPLYATQAPAPAPEPVAWVDERAIAWLQGRQRNATITTPLQAGKSFERPMALYAAPAQAPVVDGWQPIETAPLNGTRVLLHPAIEVADVASKGCWSHVERCWIVGGSPSGVRHTHWHPLPANPVSDVPVQGSSNG
ncbi:hypothetical protein [Paucibacter soli]|uniref:hypothetical protein n=1 Tax=Paucibacter soli TaxID=3133433 RepID=UPI0030B5E736